MRLGKIVSHLLANEDEFIAIMYGNATLLNVDKEELTAIIDVLTTDPKMFFPEKETNNE